MKEHTIVVGVASEISLKLSELESEGWVILPETLRVSASAPDRLRRFSLESVAVGIVMEREKEER